MKKSSIGFIGLLCLLSVSVTATIGLVWLLYPLEIDNLGIEQLTALSKDKLLINFNQLMAYLTFPWVQRLNMPNFPSSVSGLKHFADVKRLFHFAQILLLTTGIPTFYWLRNHRHQLTNYQHVFKVLVLIPIIIGGFGMLIGFETFFILFHQFLFPGDSSWLFDPATDPVINSLPETLFLHSFLIFAGIYGILSLGLLGLAYYSRKDSL